MKPFRKYFRSDIDNPTLFDFSRKYVRSPFLKLPFNVDLFTVFALRFKIVKGISYLYTDKEDSDNTGRMSRLVSVFKWRTCHC